MAVNKKSLAENRPAAKTPKTKSPKSPAATPAASNMKTTLLGPLIRSVGPASPSGRRSLRRPPFHLPDVRANHVEQHSHQALEEAAVFAEYPGPAREPQ